FALTCLRYRLREDVSGLLFGAGNVLGQQFGADRRQMLPVTTLHHLRRWALGRSDPTRRSRTLRRGHALLGRRRLGPLGRLASGHSAAASTSIRTLWTLVRCRRSLTVTPPIGGIACASRATRSPRTVGLSLGDGGLRAG